MALESVFIENLASQAFTVIVLVIILYRVETMLKKCQSNTFDTSLKLLTLIGEILCDKNDAEQCRKFEAFRASLMTEYARRNA